MNDSEFPQASAAEGPGYQSCPCQQIMNGFQQLFGVSPAARHHFTNSRIELLKGMRAVLDQRIERISAEAKQGTGTRVVVE